jgi:uncharacterized protein YegP (UPF0339 family)
MRPKFWKVNRERIMTDEIVDYVEIVKDRNGKYRVRGLSDNGEIVWSSEQYESFDWAKKVAEDTGKEVREVLSQPISVDEVDVPELPEETEPIE